jgi:putative FmdB family regulatory protein
MPTYEYRCPNGHEFDVLHRMDDPPPAACEVCGAGPVTRVFRPVPVFFKGSGFYSTDYGRGKRKKEEATADGGAKAGDDTKKADKKPEKKAEAAEA